MYAAVPRGDVKAGVEKSVKCEQRGGAGLTRKGCGAEGQAAVGPVGAAKVGGGGHNAAAVACMISIGVVYVCTVSSDNTHGGRGGGLESLQPHTHSQTHLKIEWLLTTASPQDEFHRVGRPCGRRGRRGGRRPCRGAARRCSRSASISLTSQLLKGTLNPMWAWGSLRQTTSSLQSGLYLRGEARGG